MNFNTLPNGSSDGFCLISALSLKTTAKGMKYLDLTLSDSSGEINGKLWDYSEDIHSGFAVGDIVKVRGVISQYNGADQLRVDRIRKSELSDNVNPADFVKSAEFSGEKMFEALTAEIEAINNTDIKNITSQIINSHKEKLLFWPAAFKLHHVIRGGLLYHTLSILRLADSVCKIYPFVNADLLKAGVILHDVAKIYEFQITESGTAAGYTVEGNLIGHLAKGAIIIEEFAAKCQTPEKLKIMLQHMVLSHHGEPEFGAAVRPMFIEAEILSQLDNLDATIYEMADAVFKTKPDDFSDRLWCLDNRKLYNHATGGNEMSANIIK